MRGVIDHLGRHQDRCPRGVCPLPPADAGHRMPYPLLSPTWGALPVEQKQEGEHRQVGGGHVGLLLEADEDDNDQRRGDHIVALKVKQGNEVHPCVKDTMNPKSSPSPDKKGQRNILKNNSELMKPHKLLINILDNTF